MLKEKILELGFVLSENEVDRLVELMTLELEGFVPKGEFDEVVSQKERLEVEVSEKGALLEDFGRFKDESSVKESEYLALVDRLKAESAVELALSRAGGKNLKAIKALINMGDISVDESGNILGLDEQMEKLLGDENTAFLFEDKDEISIKGATPVVGEKTQGISKSDFQKMSYKERLEIYNKDEELYKELCY